MSKREHDRALTRPSDSSFLSQSNSALHLFDLDRVACAVCAEFGLQSCLMLLEPGKLTQLGATLFLRRGAKKGNEDVVCCMSPFYSATNRFASRCTLLLDACSYFLQLLSRFRTFGLRSRQAGLYLQNVSSH